MGFRDIMRVAPATVTFLASALLVVGLIIGVTEAIPLTPFAAPTMAILSVQRGGPPPPLKSGCGSLTLDMARSSIPPFAGSPATLLYGCGHGGRSPAFTTTRSHSEKKLTATPVFSVPQGWNLGLSELAGSGECTSGVITLKSGTPITLSPGTGYIYCLTTSGASSFFPFSIAWTRLGKVRIL